MADLLSAIRTTDRRWRIGMLNGPNMPNLGRRDRATYGDVQSLADLEQRVGRVAEGLGVDLAKCFASNYEGAILDWIHAETDDLDGLLVNPAGLTMGGQATARALHDTGLPIVEVHFGNVGHYSYQSIFTREVVGTCHGLRKHSYTAALVALVAMLDDGDFVKPALYAPREI